MAKTLIVSHRDHDGFGANILGRVLIGNGEHVHTENLEISQVDNYVTELITSKEYKIYDEIYIIDLSVNEETAKLIDEYIADKVILLDHHKTAEFLNKYNWATVKTEMDGELTCGTELFFVLLQQKYYIEPEMLHVLEDVVRHIKLYDTWLWQKYNNLDAKKFNDLFYILGPNKFIPDVCQKIIKTWFKENPFSVKGYIKENKELLELEQEKIDRYINKKDKSLVRIKVGKYTAGLIYSDQYHSELGNKLSLKYPDLDFILMIDGGKASLRSAKENIDCGEIAALFGGGGHKGSAGFYIPEFNKLVENLLNNILNFDI